MRNHEAYCLRALGVQNYPRSGNLQDGLHGRAWRLSRGSCRQHQRWDAEYQDMFKAVEAVKKTDSSIDKSGNWLVCYSAITGQVFLFGVLSFNCLPYGAWLVVPPTLKLPTIVHLTYGHSRSRHRVRDACGERKGTDRTCCCTPQVIWRNAEQGSRISV